MGMVAAGSVARDRWAGAQRLRPWTAYPAHRTCAKQEPHAGVPLEWFKPQHTAIGSMKTPALLPLWTPIGPAIALLLLAGQQLDLGKGYVLVLAAGLVVCVLASVHHAEVVAHRVGEPYGTLLMAGAITVIEVALIVSLVVAGGAGTAELARDTVFATVVIILNGIIGVCLLVGAPALASRVLVNMV